ncbi:MAG TPA: thymidine phosphorylase [Acidobacteriaceae bacterium]|nr:thymidine phosphorylase [Acidobacteriaceae bacterium]
MPLTPKAEEKETIYTMDLLRKKRDGHALTKREMQHLVHSVTTGTISTAQIGAFLMAVYLRGLTGDELHALTNAMRFSGEVFDSRPLGKFTVDKHSTGGVGDKTSLLIAPIAAAAGLAVPMISGRSLGHTGGTLDKLETIPGFNSQLSMKEFFDVIQKCGASLIGQTKTLVPADRILYSLRDHTSTVESPNLITASIMSKKLAEGLDGLVLDVKTGSGAFMSKFEDAEHLARLMVGTGEAAGTRTAALLTSMDEPLGRFSGNWIEVWECVDIMKNIRHAMSADLIQLSLLLSGWMLCLGGKAETPEDGVKLADELLTNGSAYKKWLEIVALQGGDTTVFENPAAFHKPKATRVLKAWRSGYLGCMDCRQVGWAVQRLGAGREKVGDPVAAHAGIEMHAKIGARLNEGDALCTLFAEDERLLDGAEQLLRPAIQIDDTRPVPSPLVRMVITAKDIRN